MRELEIIQHNALDGITIFVDTLDYRTPHIHPEWELLWVLDESLCVTCENHEFVVKSGQMVLFEPDFPHELRKVGNSCTFLCLQIAPENMHLQEFRLQGRLVNDYLSAEQMDRLKLTVLEAAHAYFSKTEYYELLCTGNAALTLYRLLTALPTHVMTQEESSVYNRKNARLKRLIRFVDENYMHKIRLTDFAADEGCSVGYLSHFIKEAMNQTFQEYVNSVRFSKACALIVSGEKKMLDVCFESGFSDYRYFSKVFKQRYGLTPEQYSRSSRQTICATTTRRSTGSVERFYSAKESLALLSQLII